MLAAFILFVIVVLLSNYSRVPGCNPNKKWPLRLKLLNKRLCHAEYYCGGDLLNYLDSFREWLYNIHDKWEAEYDSHKSAKQMVGSKT